MGRVARETGAGSPLLLARRYNLITQDFLDSLQPIEIVLSDSEIINSVIGWENDLQEAATKAHDKENAKPKGLVRYVSTEERSEQLRKMRSGD